MLHTGNCLICCIPVFGNIMAEQIKAVRGVRDLLPEELRKWNVVETHAVRLFEIYGFEEIRIPLIEDTGLFQRSVGDYTDIVQKEMYVFSDKKGRKLALRPEATASVARAYIEHRIFEKEKIARFYYSGPMFRYDRPQKGRYRQFYQMGAEIFGGKSGRYDAELMLLLSLIIKSTGQKNCFAEINSIGCEKCKIAYSEKLRDFLQEKNSGFCPDCRVRVSQNVLRVLDCKVAGCREILNNAPVVAGVLCDDCQHHAETVREYLDIFHVPYRENPRLVRGLDYYTKSVFEFKIEGDENAVAGGGRYDNLISDLSGPVTPAVGFAIGMDRLCETVEQVPVRNEPVWMIFLGDKAFREGIHVTEKLREAGVNTVVDYDKRSLKSYLKTAAGQKAEKVLILGEDELSKHVFLYRSMKDGTQEFIGFDEVVRFMQKNIVK